MRVLVVCAVPREAEAMQDLSDALVVVSGVGRTNAAIATTRALIEEGPFDAVLSVGIAGSLSGAGTPLQIGDVVLASESVYHEEGLITSEGFLDTSEMGFPLGAFRREPNPEFPGSAPATRWNRSEGRRRHGRDMLRNRCGGCRCVATNRSRCGSHGGRGRPARGICLLLPRRRNQGHQQHHR